LIYKILIVEDQVEIKNIMNMYLSKEGYVVYSANNGFEAMEIFNKTTLHLILLDIMMPGIDGYEVLSAIRETSEIPVIMVTAKQEEMDRIKGFNLGVDDYVLKPFSMKELILRIKRMLKRTYGELEEKTYACFDLILHEERMTLYRKGDEITITGAEYQLLLVLFQNQGRVLTREQLIEKAFGQDYDGYDRNIDSYIKRIRQKIEIDPKHPKILITKYGVGYVFGGELT
jgi:DNA-binding response OmpR family regulator